jgi:hypothetical protein
MPEHHSIAPEQYLLFWSLLGDLWTSKVGPCAPSTRAVALIGLMEALA